MSLPEAPSDLPITSFATTAISADTYQTRTLDIENLSGVDKETATYLRSLQINTVQHMASVNPLSSL
jgi:hypothetical protein